MSNPDVRYMSRALHLASNGLGLVRPNPVVGCVIVHNDYIIGEGFHHRYGGPHAEVEAIKNVLDKSLLKEATVYVTLEPCSHQGKTPPCSDLLIDHMVKSVVVANVDPNPLVAGKGLEKMRKAGIEVVIGVLDEAGDLLNRRFFTYHEKKRPHIILKWAQTADGFIARSNHDSKWISSVRSRQLVHKWRAEEAAILVGKHTVMYDNPSLTTREWSGEQPLRIVLDPNGELRDDFQLFNGSVPTLRFIVGDPKWEGDVRIEGNDFLLGVMNELYHRNIQSVFVEGGAATHKELIKQDLWDEARVFTSVTTFGEGIEAPNLDLPSQRTRLIDGDRLDYYENK